MLASRIPWLAPLPLALACAFPACSSPSNSGGTGGAGGSNSAGTGGAIGAGTGGSSNTAGRGAGGTTGGTGGAGGAGATSAGGGGVAGRAGMGGTGGGGAGMSSAGTLSSGAGNGGASGTGAGNAGTGSGGVAGMIGTAGSGAGSTAGMSASGAGGTSGVGCAAVAGKILCEDFESETAGSLPTGAPWAAQNCFDTTHVLKVDGGAHHGGAQALLGENIPYADCQLHADLGASLGEYWVRAWVYYGGAAPTSSTHEVSVFELVPVAGTDDPSIRVGYRGDTCSPVGVEVNITGGGQEETGCTGAIPTANTWYCYVLHVKQAATSVTADLSIDGADQSYTNHGNPQTEITSQVAGVQFLRLGPRSYSGNFANPIYVDDVAVATQPLGCE